jgi:hypothetical protein
MAKKKCNQKDLGSQPMQVPEVPTSVKEIEAKKRLAKAKAIGLLELLRNHLET